MRVAESRWRLGECTREELTRRLPESTVVVPVGSVEQHGLHLPLLTDTILVEAVAERAAREATGSVPLLVAPAQAYGSSHHHLPYPTMSLRSETLLVLLRDVGTTLARSGARRVFFLNGHGGNESLVGQAVRDLSLEHDALFGAASYWALAWDDWRDTLGLLDHGPVPGHAGWFETSGLLAVRPDLVDHARRPTGPADAASPQPDDGGVRAVVERHGWVRRTGGFTDGSEAASAERGEAWLAAAGRAVARFLADFHRRL